jgi:hypothetical protein
MMLTAPMLQAQQVDALCAEIESFLDAVGRASLQS